MPQFKRLCLLQQIPNARAKIEGRGTPPGPKSGLLSNTWKWIVQERHVLTKQEMLLGKGTRAENSRTQGTQENHSATWLTVLGFMVMGFVSGLSLANYNDSESFLVLHTLFSQDGLQREGFREVVGHVVSPFDLSWTHLVAGGLLSGGGLLVLCSLPGSPVVKQLMQMVTLVPGRGFSQCASPNKGVAKGSG